jgi:hypothetical protein
MAAFGGPSSLCDQLAARARHSTTACTLLTFRRSATTIRMRGITPYSYVDFAFFPLTLDGRLYLAVGYEGLSWREDARALFAVYAAPHDREGELLPLAGFAIVRVPTGLQGTEVTSVVKDRSPAGQNGLALPIHSNDHIEVSTGTDFCNLRPLPE